MPLITAIMPTYNRAATIRRACDSVLIQDFDDFELLIVDDGSDDSTQDIIASYGDRIRTIRQDNRGVSAARNRGIIASDSEFLAFIDSDDQWLPGKLRLQHEFMTQQRDLLISQTDEIWVRNGRRVNPGERHRKRGGDIFAPSLELCLISPSAVIMRRELFERYGIFDEEMPVCEDYDLWIRTTAHESCGFIEDRLALHFGGHHDQLSARYWGMDRFRAYSIIKLLISDCALSDEKRQEAAEAAAEKCRILASGAFKRNNAEFGRAVREIISQLCCGDYSSIDYRILLQG